MMRILLDPGLGAHAAPQDEADQNLAVALATGAALRIATGDGLEVALTRRGAGSLGYAELRLILDDADLVVHIERGPAEVAISTKAAPTARDAATRIAAELRRELRHEGFPIRRDSYRRLLKGCPHLVVVSLPVAPAVRLAAALAAALAGLVTRAAMAPSA
jgi:hypothetical protein